MKKYRNQEIVIGFLLGTLFWLPLIAWSSLPSPIQPTEKPAQNGTGHEPKKGSAEEEIALYTLWLAIFTGALVVVSGVQIRFLIRTDRTVRLSADAAKASAEHIPRVERAYLSGGGAPRIFTGNDMSLEVLTFHLDINNYGKTPGELLEYGIGWCDADDVAKLPDRPQYKWFFYRDMIKPGIGSRTIKFLPIPREFARPVIFGRLGYRDIFGESHSDGFIQEGGKPIMAPHPSYTAPDPEWDLPEVGKRKYEEDDPKN